jgi:organic radical activating enzyme
MNNCFENLNRIEFVVTYDCTGKCKHCSEGDHPYTGVHLKENIADVLCKIKKEYNITSVMTFGGEPLLYPDTVCAIHTAATELGIEKRQLITNGFFSKDADVIKAVARKLSKCGVNDILLSVDAFHQETIPLDTVKKFAFEIKDRGINIKTSPAWLVSRIDENPYNIKTSEIVEAFKSMGIDEGSGNIIFPEGNALKYLKEYFDCEKEYINPYEENPEDIRSVSIEPDGTLLGKSIYEKDIIDILESYKKQTRM